MSKCRSEWSSTYVWILNNSDPQLIENNFSAICKFFTVNFEKLAQDLVLKNGIPQMLGHQNGDGLGFE